jgi:hypothetical protein
MRRTQRAAGIGLGVLALLAVTAALLGYFLTRKAEPAPTGTPAAARVVTSEDGAKLAALEAERLTVLGAEGRARDAALAQQLLGFLFFKFRP